MFDNSETETCMESCIIHFPTTPPCSTKVDVLATSDVPFLFSLSRMKNLGTTIELDPKEDQITCPAFGLYSSPAESSAMGHIVLDLRNLSYQPTTKTREQSGHPKRHVTFAMSGRRQAYPAHAPDKISIKRGEDMPVLQFLKTDQGKISRERTSGTSSFWTMDRQRLETKPSDF